MSGYGPPPAAPPQSSPRRANSSQPEPHLLGYAAGVLGVLSFVWGFLDWYTVQGQGQAGYSFVGGGAGAAIGLSLTAGLLAAGIAVERRNLPVAPVAIALSAFLVTLGVLIRKAPSGTDVGTGVGLILELVTTIVQTLLLGYLYLHATGRLPAPRPRNTAPAYPPGPGGASHYGQFAPPPGQFPPAQPPGGYAPAPAQHAGGQPGYHPPYDPSQQSQPQGYGHQPYQPPQYPQQPFAAERFAPPQEPAETTQLPAYGGEQSSGQWPAPEPAGEQWSPPQAYSPLAEPEPPASTAGEETGEHAAGTGESQEPHSGG